MKKQFLHSLNSARESGKKQLAMLIDPDSQTQDQLANTLLKAEEAEVDYYFVGGSLMLKDHLDLTIKLISEKSTKPVMIFPGSAVQVSAYADGILFLSLISGRNPDLLIGQQVIAAPYVKQANLEVVPTGYLLVDCGKATTATYMSHSMPIPYHKPEIAACTALAGEYLGHKMIYMDGGSGADQHISEEMVAQVKKMTNIPIVVGGGITSPQEAERVCRAGADLVVVGNAFEKDPTLAHAIAQTVHSI